MDDVDSGPMSLNRYCRPDSLNDGRVLVKAELLVHVLSERFEKAAAGP